MLVHRRIDSDLHWMLPSILYILEDISITMVFCKHGRYFASSQPSNLSLSREFTILAFLPAYPYQAVYSSSDLPLECLLD